MFSQQEETIVNQGDVALGMDQTRSDNIFTTSTLSDAERIGYDTDAITDVNFLDVVYGADQICVRTSVN
jgi:hypothetical protein